MRFTWIASAALTLGATSLIPAMAQADERHDDRGHQRVEVRADHRDDRHVEYRRNDRYEQDRYVRVERDVHVDVRYVPVYRSEPVATYREVCPPDFDVTVGLNEVPERVICAAREQSGGRRIESIQYVRRFGKLFYRVRVDGWRDHDTNLRFTPDGGLLSVEPAGPEYR